jgi:hypothetical protein
MGHRRRKGAALGGRRRVISFDHDIPPVVIG